VDRGAVNSIAKSKENFGVSFVLNLCKNSAGISILTCDNYRLLDMVERETLNYIIGQDMINEDETPQREGECVAYYLSCKQERINLLLHNERRLASMISRATLDHIILIANITGKTVATDFVNSELENMK
jgi:hypothetical protein